MGPEGCNKVMKTHVQILETASAIAVIATSNNVKRAVSSGT